MCLFSKKLKFSITKDQSVMIFSVNSFESLVSSSEAAGKNRYLVGMVSWLLAGQDSDSRLLYQAVRRKYDEKAAAFMKTLEKKGEADGSFGTDNI
jgi:hypothetical protein